MSVIRVCMCECMRESACVCCVCALVLLGWSIHRRRGKWRPVYISYIKDYVLVLLWVFRDFALLPNLGKR